MKPFTSCPGCGGRLENFQSTSRWFEQICYNRCPLEFYQHFSNSFDDDRLKYLHFKTEHFFMYVYFEDGAYPNIAHIYSNAEMEANHKAMPIIKMPADQIDIHKRIELDKRLQTLVLFT